MESVPGVPGQLLETDRPRLFLRTTRLAGGPLGLGPADVPEVLLECFSIPALRRALRAHGRAHGRARGRAHGRGFPRRCPALGAEGGRSLASRGQKHSRGRLRKALRDERPSRRRNGRVARAGDPSVHWENGRRCRSAESPSLPTGKRENKGARGGGRPVT
jgi:hypothetical protein